MKNWLPFVLACIVVGCSGNNTSHEVLPELSGLIVAEKDMQKIIDAIKKAGNVDVPDEGGRTPLMYAAGIHVNSSLRDAGKAGNPNKLAIVKALVEKKANVNAGPNNGYTTVLKTLVYHGETESIRFLLEHGAKPDLMDGLGSMTPLMLASYRCYPDIVESLLKAGAKKEIKDSANKTALDYAKLQGCAEAIAKLN